jgi:cytochrome P450
MGKGLIPADPITWRSRRKAIVPGFHKNWYQHMCSVFYRCMAPLQTRLSAASETGEVVDMEQMFCSVSLDIIGKAVFNYEFGSVTKESPVIKAVYSALKEVGNVERMS